ncbi:MAG: redoxin domain-containing protein [Candidatus Eiseniibacteriota bacterium]
MRAAAFLLTWTILAATGAQADDSCLVRGRLRGHDGKPLPKVRVLPIVREARSTIPDREGGFTLKVPCGAARVLSIEAVHYRELMVPVLPESGQVLEFEARLRPLEWAGRFDSVRVIGEFNRYATEAAVPMPRRRDGTFAATIPCERESLRYQLLGVAKDGLPTAGTLADTLFLRAGRGVSSIRAGGKAVEVVFDPRRLPRSQRDAVVRFDDPRGPSASVYPLFREDNDEEERLSAAYRAHVAAGGDRDSFRWDRSRYAGSLGRRIPAERDPLRRRCLLLSYCRHAGAGIDSGLARRALEEIPPESPLWGLSPGGPAVPLGNIWQATHRPDLIRAYAEKGSETNPDRDVRAGFLSVAMSEAKNAGDRNRLGRYVTRMADEFQGTYYSEITQKQFAPNRKIRPGEMAPEIALSGLEDSTRIIRLSEFRGRHLLLDFWAVWCGPCRAEMPGIHRAWESFKERGLAMVSVSFDRQPADVVAYRRDKWPMPWLHAFAAEGFGGEASAAFDVWGIPKAILIGPDGAIIAEGSDLRGEKLHETLARVLGAPASAAPRKD